MKYDFKEAQLDDDFCEDRLHKIRNLLTPSGLFTIVGIPGVGISFFIRFLATRNFARFIYLDTSSLTALNKYEFYTALLKELGGTKISKSDQEILNECKKRIKELLKKEKHIVFLFNRFDDLGRGIDKNLLDNLRTLRHIAADKISMIFVTHKGLYDVSPDAVSDANLDLFSNLYYFASLPKDDLEKLFLLHSPDLISEKKIFDEVYELSGGHYQLAKLILKTGRRNDLLTDKFIKISLKKIYDKLTYLQKKTLAKITFNKTVDSIDAELIRYGFVIGDKSDYRIFSPVFEEYIKENASIKLSVKEAKLFALLKKKLGRVVAKEELFRSLWLEDGEEFGSDWALNSLIYRLRKNPMFVAKGFVIESHKKTGYMLVKN